MSTMPDPHAAHDPLLVAAHAAGDAAGADLDRAAALVASCPECARLHRDLRALSAALAAAPAPARPRDFRLSAAQAEGLRRPSGWRRLLAPLAPARSAAGPLAASLAALGLAGLLVGGGLRLPLGAGTTALAPVPGGAGAPQAAASEAAASAMGMNYDTGGGSSVAGQAAPSFAAPAPTAAPAASAPAASAAASMAAASMPAASEGPQAASSGNVVASAAASASSGGVVHAASPVVVAGPSGGESKTASTGSQAAASIASGPASSEAAVLAPVTPGATPSPVRPMEVPGEQGSGPSPLVIASVLLLAAGLALGVLRLIARRFA